MDATKHICSGSQAQALWSGADWSRQQMLAPSMAPEGPTQQPMVLPGRGDEDALRFADGATANPPDASIAAASRASLRPALGRCSPADLAAEAEAARAQLQQRMAELRQQQQLKQLLQLKQQVQCPGPVRQPQQAQPQQLLQPLLDGQQMQEQDEQLLLLQQLRQFRDQRKHMLRLQCETNERQQQQEEEELGPQAKRARRSSSLLRLQSDVATAETACISCGPGSESPDPMQPGLQQQQHSQPLAPVVENMCFGGVANACPYPIAGGSSCGIRNQGDVPSSNNGSGNANISGDRAHNGARGASFVSGSGLGSGGGTARSNLMRSALSGGGSSSSSSGSPFAPFTLDLEAPFDGLPSALSSRSVSTVAAPASATSIGTGNCNAPFEPKPDTTREHLGSGKLPAWGWGAGGGGAVGAGAGVNGAAGGAVRPSHSSCGSGGEADDTLEASRRMPVLCQQQEVQEDPALPDLVLPPPPQRMRPAWRDDPPAKPGGMPPAPPRHCLPPMPVEAPHQQQRAPAPLRNPARDWPPRPMGHLGGALKGLDDSPATPPQAQALPPFYPRPRGPPPAGLPPSPPPGYWRHPGMRLPPPPPNYRGRYRMDPYHFAAMQRRRMYLMRRQHMLQQQRWQAASVQGREGEPSAAAAATDAADGTAGPPIQMQQGARLVSNGAAMHQSQGPLPAMPSGLQDDAGPQQQQATPPDAPSAELKPPVPRLLTSPQPSQNTRLLQRQRQLQQLQSLLQRAASGSSAGRMLLPPALRDAIFGSSSAGGAAPSSQAEPPAPPPPPASPPPSTTQSSLLIAPLETGILPPSTPGPSLDPLGPNPPAWPLGGRTAQGVAGVAVGAQRVAAAAAAVAAELAIRRRWADLGEVEEQEISMFAEGLTFERRDRALEPPSAWRLNPFGAAAAGARLGGGGGGGGSGRGAARDAQEPWQALASAASAPAVLPPAEAARRGAREQVRLAAGAAPRPTRAAGGSQPSPFASGAMGGSEQHPGVEGFGGRCAVGMATAASAPLAGDGSLLDGFDWPSPDCLLADFDVSSFFAD